jgi:hypothetical protein
MEHQDFLFALVVGLCMVLNKTECYPYLSPDFNIVESLIKKMTNITTSWP